KQGNGMSLPFPDARFDVAAMALVIFFVKDPTKAVAEMVRVVRPGGIVTTYTWDVLEAGGFPPEPIQIEMRAIGVTLLRPQSAEASRMSALQTLWKNAGLEAIDTKQITVERTFSDFEDFWNTTLLGPSIGPTIA